jgi:quercetin dioxygenase-like cupin family protein
VDDRTRAATARYSDAAATPHSTTLPPKPRANTLPIMANPTPVPPDDPTRTLTITNPNAAKMRHISVAGDTYTILISGAETNGRYCLIDMYVPTGGGPPPHRHDFEEMFTLLEGELEFTFRGEKSTAGAGSTLNIPSNAPHAFRNVSNAPARLLCMCTPAGQEEFFMEIGDLVASRTAPPPKLTEDEIAKRRQKAGALLAQYRTEMVEPLN